MLKRYEIPILLTSIFVLILILRFLFHFTFINKFEAGENVAIEYVFLSLPMKNDFQQYFFIDDLLVTLPLFPEYTYGDKFRLKGTVSTYTSSRNDKVSERLVLKNPEVKIEENKGLAVLKFVRQKVLSAYKSVLPPREAGLMSGIVLGVEDGINENFKNELKRTGMLHVVVASGSNIVLVAGIVFSLIGGLVKKRMAIIFTIICIFFYAFLTGFDPPIVRASIMASFAFTAMLLGRQKIAMFSLLFSGWIMLMVSPKLISDIGFQLSFSASFGIIMFQKVLHHIVRFVPKIAKEDFATTLSAQIGAMPFLLIAFGEVNLLSIFINVVLLWTVPIIMVFGLAGAVLGLISPLISSPIILLTYPFLAYFSYIVSFTSDFYIPLTLTSIFTPIAIIYYILLVFILIRLKIKDMKAVLVILGSFLIVVTIMVTQFLNSSSSSFKMVFCDVGQGDSIYIRAFSQDIIIDGGPADDSVLRCLGRHMPLFDRNIELMVVTHADSDHYSGFLGVLDSYTVSNFATSHGDSDVLGYQALVNKLEKNGVEVKRLTQGERIRINDEVKIDVLWPPSAFTDIDSDRNNSSLVFMVDYKDFETILTGDLDKEYLNLLLHDLSQIEIFKLAHHGSHTGTNENTFEVFRPELSIISAGVDNRYGHPHKEVIDTLNKFDLKYLSTQDGDIVIESDGEKWEAKQN